MVGSECHPGYVWISYRSLKHVNNAKHTFVTFGSNLVTFRVGQLVTFRVKSHSIKGESFVIFRVVVTFNVVVT